ncbi:MAG: sulfite exporter TauE/SafE family protein [Candidatus Krumholzibacteria bacterium]|nr:sulfite exporter TauE/SafE family protein [Candidatus Krumholzibacteria bacterium]
MEEWIQQALSADRLGIISLSAAFLLGILGALSSCCTLPVIGAVAGYAGTLGERLGRRRLMLIVIFFTIGIALSLAGLGIVTGLLGQAAGASAGKYWRFAAGLMLVVFGLANLRLLRFKAPSGNPDRRALGESAGGAMVYGLAIGGGTAACSVACNPLLPMAVGAAVLKGTPVMGAALLAVFGLGFSLPLVAGLVGVGLGLNRLGTVAQRAMPAMRVGVGALLIAVGFYLLATV